MTSPIDIPAILIANLMGIMILFVIAVGNSWQSKMIFQENKSLKIMFLSCFMLCFADPACFLADGKPGYVNYLLVYWCNMCLYIGNIITALMFVKLIIDRLGVKLRLIHKVILLMSVSVNIVLTTLNLFVPVVFYVEKDNVYHRAGLYWILNIFYIIVILFGLLIYIVERRRSGNLKFFPIWAFLVPAATGLVIQSVRYGVSVATPFVTVGIVCIFINLQNEFIYRDKLTGLYNRFYLEMITKSMAKNTKYRYSAMMLDLNGFKKINDTYGHETGDKALILFSQILRKIVGTKGEVIRYAGDEFVIILHTQDEDMIKNTIAEIHSSLDAASGVEEAPYKLSVAIGYTQINQIENSVEHFIDKMDKLMYINKQEYYKATPKYR